MYAEPQTEQLLTANDVADCLSISTRTVWRWVDLGRIPRPIRLGYNVIRWKASDIQKLIDSQPVCS